MAFTPHTQNDITLMLEAIGVARIEDLFDEIPKTLRKGSMNPDIVPNAISEMQARREFTEIAKRDQAGLCFIGAGAYEHHIPAAVWQLASRGEFLTAYTPYQAEASQGLLQLLYEYQTMAASLLGMDVANASLYDGASAAAEAVLMAVRANRRSRSRRILVPMSLHPHYRQTINTIVKQQAVEIVEVPFNEKTGKLTIEDIEHFASHDDTAIVIPQPNFFGVLEDVDALTHWAHQHNMVTIAVVNPTAMALLKEPGTWGEHGADIACGEGQPLGVPLASGGPYFGFLGCKRAFIRQMPGRLVGRTVDSHGKPGFVLTLQAREQHIRRSKATSNICTNQGLLVTVATIYMALLGPEGLNAVAAASHSNTKKLLEKLTKISGVEQVFSSPFFHEILLRLLVSADTILAELAKVGIQGGVSLTKEYPELGECILVCATETKTKQDIAYYQQQLGRILYEVMQSQHIANKQVSQCTVSGTR